MQKEVFWSRDLLFLRTSGPDAHIDIPFDVAEDGFYELVAQIAHAPDYGNYRAMLDGKPLEPETDLEHEPGANAGGAVTIAAWNTETYVAEDHLLGWRKLTKGKHLITFQCFGKDPRSTNYHLGIDTLILAKVGTPEDVRAPQVPSTVPDLIRTLEAGDPVLRGVAALALRDMGTRAQPALPALAKALRDPDTGVRMVAADAIARQGHSALAVLDALIAAGAVPGEHAHVQRSVAIALGAIGPDAAPALTMLRELEKIPRVRPTAATAIRQITNRSR